jgi:hypothetical protein
MKQYQCSFSFIIKTWFTGVCQATTNTYIPNLRAIVCCNLFKTNSGIIQFLTFQLLVHGAEIEMKSMYN